MPRLAVFGYGSLVDRASVSRTLGREVERVWPCRLDGFVRRFSQSRDNRTCEKTFARTDDGTVPESILGLNLERGDEKGPGPNGVLIELDETELDRLDVREIRYDRLEVGPEISADAGTPAFDRVVSYVAKPDHLAPVPPPGAVILRSYAAAVEAAFATLGAGAVAEYRRTTLPFPVELIAAELIRDRIPDGNPRAW